MDIIVATVDLIIINVKHRHTILNSSFEIESSIDIIYRQFAVYLILLSELDLERERGDPDLLPLLLQIMS